MFDQTLIGKRLKELRIRSGRKQEDIAMSVGIKQSAMSSQEKGLSVPRTETIYKYAELYHVSSDYILGLTDDPRRLYEMTSERIPPSLHDSDLDAKTAAALQSMIDSSLKTFAEYYDLKPPANSSATA